MYIRVDKHFGGGGVLYTKIAEDAILEYLKLKHFQWSIPQDHTFGTCLTWFSLTTQE